VSQLSTYYSMMPTVGLPRRAYEKEGTAIHTGLLPQAERAAGEGAVGRSRASASIAKRPPAEVPGDIDEGRGPARPVTRFRAIMKISGLRAYRI